MGTHKPKPKEALGLLADKKMRKMKEKCHELFDLKWKNEPTSKKRHKARKDAYKWLADKMNIPESECHFGYFDIEMLRVVYKIIEEDY